MKNQLRFLTVLLLSLFGGVNVWAVTYTWTTAKDQLSATTTSVTVDDVTWQFSPTWQDDTKTYVSWSGGSTNCYQIGSSNNPLSCLQLSTTGISGTISKIEVIWSSASSKEASLSVTVGGNAFGGTATSSSNTLSTSTFEGESEGQIVLTFTATTGIKFQKLVVVYVPDNDDRTPVTLSFDPGECDATYGEEFTAPTLTVEPNEIEINRNIIFTSSKTGVATVDEVTGEVTLVNRGTTVITASFAGNEDFQPADASYTLNVYKESVVVDGFFDFEDKTLYYNTILRPSSSDDYIYDDVEWEAGNVTLKTSGKYRWWEEDGTLRFYNNDPKSSMTLSVPYGYVITNISISGGRSWATDVDGYNSNTGKWEGQSRVVKFEQNTTSRVDVKSITVTYMEFVPSTQLIDPELSYSAATATAELGINFDAPTLSYVEGFTGIDDIVFSSSDEGVATVDEDGWVTTLTAGTTVITASFPGNENFLQGSASYTLTVTELTAPVGYKYMTYCSTNNLDFTGKDLKAYIASGYRAGTLMLTRVYQVKAKTGILIRSADEDLPAAFLEMDYVTTENISATYSNMLVGVTLPTTIYPTYYNMADDNSYTVYVLSKPKDKALGFYPISKSLTLGANKAYLPIISEESILTNEITFEINDDTDAIQGVETKTINDDAWYTIQGVRVAQPTQSGVYIHNGVKVVVK